MPNTDAHGLVAPDDSDVFAPAADIRAGRVPLRSRIVVPIANDAAQADLVTAHSPSSSTPLTVNHLADDVMKYTRNGTDWVRIGGAVSRIPVNLSLWSSNTMHITREVTADGFRVSLRGRLARLSGTFTLSTSWVGIGSISLPTTMRPNIASEPTDVLLPALYNGHTPISFLLDTGTGAISIRSQLTSINWGVGDYFQVEGASWSRKL